MGSGYRTLARGTDIGSPRVTPGSRSDYRYREQAQSTQTNDSRPAPYDAILSSRSSRRPSIAA